MVALWFSMQSCASVAVSATTSATTTTAAAARCVGLGFVQPQFSTTVRLAVQCGDGHLGLSLGAQFRESEPSALAGRPVPDDVRAQDRSVC